jgi:hypothetical protein
MPEEKETASVPGLLVLIREEQIQIQDRLKEIKERLERLEQHTGVNPEHPEG